VSSLEVQTVEPASYYQFRDELDQAGFTTRDRGRSWTGPIAEPLRAFTESDEMTILIRDGWPYRHPDLEVAGMAGMEHVNASEYVCLWADGDRSQAWRTLAGWQARIAEWSERQIGEFWPEDATMDAHRYFEDSFDAIATMDLSAVAAEPTDGAWGAAFGRWRSGEALLQITTGRASAGNVRGTWFYRETIEVPPADLAGMAAVLCERQTARLQRQLAIVARDRKKWRQFVVLIWGKEEQENALVVLLQQRPGGDVRGRALEFAPNDTATLRLRSGEDAAALTDHAVLLFGAGSVGSQLALLLAESGLGAMTVVDGERLRPGNVVRHAAPAQLVGMPKVEAVASVVAEHAPWTQVRQEYDSPWSPSRLRELISGHEVVVDATGNAGFSEQISVLAALEGVILVRAALYRRGYVARVQRQGPDDVPIIERDNQEKYPAIPIGPEDELRTEPGCSSAVNLASPRAVASCARLAADVVVDALMAHTLPDEITDVHGPLEEAPFNRVCRLTSG
jgi:molybdopterin/thiamine biosynthesis adenylyltransferase